MKKQAFLGPGYSTGGRAQKQTAYSLAGMLSIGLTGLLLLGGCNKTPAPAAPAAEPATTAQSAPPPAAAPDATPAAPGPRSTAGRDDCRSRTKRGPPAPAAPPPPPPPQKYVVASGTPLVVRMQQTVSAKSSNVGDTFTGTLAQSVVVHGVKVIRAGAPVTGTVVAAKGQGRFKGSGDLGVAITRVGTYSVTTTSYEATAKGKGKRTAGFVGGGAGGGALIGGLAGGGKGALIGGLLGAGAGTAGAAFTGNKDITIPAESVVTFNLTQPITVMLESHTPSGVRRKGVPNFQASSVGPVGPRINQRGNGITDNLLSVFTAVAEVGLLCRSKLQILKSIIRVASMASLPVCWLFFEGTANRETSRSIPTTLRTL